MSGGLDIIDRNNEKIRLWVNEMKHELGSENEQYAYRVLRSFLHTLRDRLSTNEAAQLAAQLPELLRGVFYEGWKPSKTPIKYDLDDFLGRMAIDGALAGKTEASTATSAAIRVLENHVSKGEMQHIVQNLPNEFRALFEENQPLH